MLLGVDVSSPVRSRLVTLRSISSQVKRFDGNESKKLAYIRNGGNVPLMDKTLGMVFGEAVKKWPTIECIVSLEGNVRLTYSEAGHRVDRLAAGLTKLGMKHGDRMGILAPNDVEAFLGFLACTRLGLIATMINPAYQINELVYCIQKVGAKAVITPDSFKTQNYPRMLLEARRVCSSFEHIIVYSKNHASGTHRFCDVEQLPSRSEIERVAAEQDKISCYDKCNIQFTSGTTGKPKATVLSHRSLMNNSRQTRERTKVSMGSRACLNVPLFHAFGITVFLVALHAGATTVLESRSFNPVKSLEGMLREKCQLTYGTPTMWINMLDTHRQLRFPPIQLSFAFTGGAPAPPELFKRVRNCFNFDDLKVLYGMTESTAVNFQSMLEEDVELTDTTVGHLTSHLEAKVVDEKGSTVPFGVTGELWIRGYNNMLEYWADEENTKKTLTSDGWLKTGDQFVLRPDGYGNIIGRFKDMVIRGGENIFPKEVEDFLMTHPLVLEAQIIGAYDKVYGEELCACVRLQKGASLTKEELQNYCRGKISHFKIPRYIEFVHEYPKTGSGKVQKFILKQEMERNGAIPATPKNPTIPASV